MCGGGGLVRGLKRLMPRAVCWVLESGRVIQGRNVEEVDGEVELEQDGGLSEQPAESYSRPTTRRRLQRGPGVLKASLVICLPACSPS